MNRRSRWRQKNWRESITPEQRMAGRLASSLVSLSHSCSPTPHTDSFPSQRHRTWSPCSRPSIGPSDLYPDHHWTCLTATDLMHHSVCCPCTPQFIGIHLSGPRLAWGSSLRPQPQQEGEPMPPPRSCQHHLRWQACWSSPADWRTHCPRPRPPPRPVHNSHNRCLTRSPRLLHLHLSQTLLSTLCLCQSIALAAIHTSFKLKCSPCGPMARDYCS